MQDSKIWRYIDSGIGTAAWNMAVDEALLSCFSQGDLPILRLYGWKPALSLGRFSEPSENLDMDRIKRDGIGCVRRITGGGILVHGDDLSYAMILPRSFIAERGVRESYRYLCGFLLRLYGALGLSAAFAQERALAEKQTDICLAGREAYDIVINGNKIGGNAQRYSRQAMLQHGTIPIDLDRGRFEPLFLKESGLKDAATLRREHSMMGQERLKAFVLEAFTETFGAQVQKDALREDELKLAEKLLQEKYTKERWTIDAEDILQQA